MSRRTLSRAGRTTEMPATVRKLRCAVYTRKSTEEGLDQGFNTLDAQRDACEAYVTSQRAEGWILVFDPYDDRGLSGATLDRPALQRLLRDIEAGRIDVVVVTSLIAAASIGSPNPKAARPTPAESAALGLRTAPDRRDLPLPIVAIDGRQS